MRTDIFALPRQWPTPYDEKAADLLAERIDERGAAGNLLLQNPASLAMIRSLGGNSPYLADLAIREFSALQRLVADGPAAVVSAALDDLRSIRPLSPRTEVAAGLRRAKRIIALATAIADIGAIWPLEQVTEALSDLAEAALRVAMGHLLRRRARGGVGAPARPGEPRDRLRPRRPRHGQAGCSGAQLLVRHRSDSDLRPEGSGTGWGDVAGFDQPIRGAAGARPGGADGGSRRGRLCLPHRPAAAPRPRGDAAADRVRLRHDLLREPGAELGARGDDQGAADRRRPRRSAIASWRRSARSSGAVAWISPPSPTSTR